MPPSSTAQRARARIYKDLYAGIETVAISQRDSSAHRGPFETPNRTLSIDDAYCRYQDVEKAWSGHDTIANALNPTVLSDDDVTNIRTSQLKLLSILVYINANSVLDNFQQAFSSSNGTSTYNDNCLPLAEEDLVAIEDPVLRNLFLHHQYFFIPVNRTVPVSCVVCTDSNLQEFIVESAAPKPIDERLRLPFEIISRNEKAGAYGQIDRLGISPSYLKTAQGAAFDRVSKPPNLLAS